MSGVCLYVRKLITVTFGWYDAKTNVGCLPLRSEINYGNIRLRMTLKQNVGCLPLRSEINYGNIRLRMTLKQMSPCLPLRFGNKLR